MLRRQILVAALLLTPVVLADCSPSVASPSSVGTPRPTMQSTVSPAGPDIAPSAGGPTPSPATFSCTLPVSGFAESRAGFVTFPPATYEAVIADSLPAIMMPDLGASYSRALGRWLPVRREQVSPDGRQYAYINYTNPGRSGPSSDGVHVADAASGRDLIVIPNPATPTPPWFVVAFDSSGLYLSSRLPWNAGHPPTSPVGLWVANPSNGSVRQLTATGSWLYIGGGSAWGTDAPRKGSGPGVGSRIMRLDLGTTETQPWLIRDFDLQLVGVDAAGRPLVEANPVTASREVEAHLWLLRSPSDVVELRPPVGLALPQLLFAGTVLEDGHGVWLTAANPELWLYTPAAGLQLMHRFADAITRYLAGPCV